MLENAYRQDVCLSYSFLSYWVIFWRTRLIQILHTSVSTSGKYGLLRRKKGIVNLWIAWEICTKNQSCFTLYLVEFGLHTNLRYEHHNLLYRFFWSRSPGLISLAEIKVNPWRSQAGNSFSSLKEWMLPVS